MATAQVKEALAFAEECRVRRAQLGRELKAGDAKLSALLYEPALPNWLEGEPIDRLLNRVPGIGPQSIPSILTELRIGQKRRVGDLTYRQRRMLGTSVALRERTPRKASGKRARLRIGSTAGSAIVTFTDADGDEFPVRLPGSPAIVPVELEIEEKAARRLLDQLIDRGDFSPTMPVTITKVEAV